MKWISPKQFFRAKHRDTARSRYNGESVDLKGLDETLILPLEDGFSTMDASDDIDPEMIAAHPELVIDSDHLELMEQYGCSFEELKAKFVNAFSYFDQKKREAGYCDLAYFIEREYMFNENQLVGHPLGLFKAYVERAEDCGLPLGLYREDIQECWADFAQFFWMTHTPIPVSHDGLKCVRFEAFSHEELEASGVSSGETGCFEIDGWSGKVVKMSDSVQLNMHIQTRPYMEPGVVSVEAATFMDAIKAFRKLATPYEDFQQELMCRLAMEFGHGWAKRSISDYEIAFAHLSPALVKGRYMTIARHYHRADINTWDWYEPVPEPDEEGTVKHWSREVSWSITNKRTARIELTEEDASISIDISIPEYYALECPQVTVSRNGDVSERLDKLERRVIDVLRQIVLLKDYLP